MSFPSLSLADWLTALSVAVAVITALFGGGLLSRHFKDRIRVKRVKKVSPALLRFADFYDAVFGEDEPFDEYVDYVDKVGSESLQPYVFIALYRGNPYGLLDFEVDTANGYVFISYLATADDNRIRKAVPYEVDHAKAGEAKEALLKAACRTLKRKAKKLNACVFEVKQDDKEAVKLKKFRSIFNCGLLDIRSPIIRIDMDYVIPVTGEQPGAAEEPYSLYYYPLGEPPERLRREQVGRVLDLVIDGIYRPTTRFPEEKAQLAALKQRFLDQVPEPGLVLARQGACWFYTDERRLGAPGRVAAVPA